MTEQQRAEIVMVIHFYERHGWDWGSVVGYLCLKYSGILNLVIRTRIGVPRSAV